MPTPIVADLIDHSMTCHDTTMTSVFSRGISHAIHGPLPLDPAKTKRLLAALTALLDSAHRTSSTPPPSVSASSAPQPVSTSAFHASASHYANILQHPAFTPLTLDPKSSASTIPTALRRLQALLLQDDPNASAVEACLAALVRQTATSGAGGLAGKILSMFRAGDRVSMLHERSAAAKDFGRLALRSDRPDLARRLVLSAPTGSAAGVATTAAFLLERGPDVALRFVLSVFDGDAARTPDEAYAKCLRLVCRYLLAHPEAAGQVSREVYDEVLRQYHIRGAVITNFDRLTLGLFGPGAPNCEPALRWIRDYEEASSKVVDHWSAAYRRMVIRFSFRLAQLLIQHGQYADADFVLDFCKSIFPGDLASEESQSQKETTETAIASKVVGLLGI